MKLNKVVAIPALALAAGLSLAACGSVKAAATAPAVTHTVTAAPAAAPKPTTPAPTTPAPAPAKTVYVQAPAAPAPAAPAAPSGLRAVGIGTHGEEVYANGNTSDSFALNVERDFAASSTFQFYSYSPATGQSYLMSSNAGNPKVITGGNNALVQFEW